MAIRHPQSHRIPANAEICASQTMLSPLPPIAVASPWHQRPPKRSAAPPIRSVPAKKSAQITDPKHDKTLGRRHTERCRLPYAATPIQTENAERTTLLPMHRAGRTKSFVCKVDAAQKREAGIPFVGQCPKFQPTIATAGFEKAA